MRAVGASRVCRRCCVNVVQSGLGVASKAGSTHNDVRRVVNIRRNKAQQLSDIANELRKGAAVAAPLKDCDGALRVPADSCGRNYLRLPEPNRFHGLEYLSLPCAKGVLRTKIVADNLGTNTMLEGPCGLFLGPKLLFVERIAHAFNGEDIFFVRHSQKVVGLFLFLLAMLSLSRLDCGI